MKHFGKNILSAYKNLKLQKKLTLTHLVIAVIPMVVLGIYFYTSLYDMIVSYTISKEQNSVSEAAPLIEDAVSHIQNVSTNFQNHEFFQLVVDPGRTQDLDILSDSEEAASFRANILNLDPDDFITAIKIYADLPETEAIFNSSQTGGTFRPISEAKGTYWYGIFSGSPWMTTLLCPSFYLNTKEIQKNGSMAYITRSSVTYEDETRACYLAVYFSQDYLDQLLSDKLTSSENVAYLINSRDNTIASSNEALTGTYHFDYDEIGEYFMSSNNFIQKTVMGNEVYAGFYSIRNTDWYMVVALPARPMIVQSMQIIAVFFLMYTACIIFAFCIATFLSRSITGRLSTVINQMSKCHSGPPVALPNSHTTDEIGDLINTYNYMARMINHLMEEQANAAEDLRIAEFNSLQSQINPHFLYNTMDMINWLSLQGRSAQVSMAVQKLSRFYKLTLSRKQTMSTIADEVEHASIYVQLQNMRFHDHIDFLVDIPDFLMDSQIPKLTLQPIIENSILHGILEKPSKQGTIVLTGWLEEKTIVLLISDDGVGIPPCILSDILSGEKQNASGSGTNIAVCNTHRRLQVLYGPDYGLRYRSKEGEGTEVEIRIPEQESK